MSVLKEYRVLPDIEKHQDFKDGMPFLGGALWLDLANSSFSLDGRSFDFLSDEASFARWVEAAGFAITPTALAAERRAALRLRDLAREIFGTLTAGEPLTAGQVGQINAALANRTIHERLRLVDGGVELDFPDRITGPAVATRLAGNLAHFLVDYEPERLKSCDNPACEMVFYDRGKNNRRRWCTMSICGNRDKVANYRARKSSSGPD